MNLHISALPSLLLLALGCAAPTLACAQNPLARNGQDQVRQDPFVGTFRGAELTLTLRAGDAKNEYRGDLVFGGKTYPCTAQATGAALRGKFTVDRENFEFTAQRRDEALQLTTDGTEYTLQRQEAGNPLGGAKRQVPAANENGGDVGITFTENEDGEFVIATVLPGGPASKSVQVGWTLEAIDDREVDEMTLAQVQQALRGKPGSLVKLTFDTPKEVIDALVQRAAPVGANAAPAQLPENPLTQGPITKEPIPQGTPAPQAAGEVPEAVRQGQRLSFLSASATIAGLDTVLVEDDKGNLFDPKTGQRYSTQNNTGQGAMSIEQLDLLHADGGVLAGDVTTFLVDPLSGALSTTTTQPITGNFDALGEYWVHPAKLATLQAGEEQGTRILRGPHEQDGQRYDTVTVRRTTTQGFSRYTYDTRTGLCVFSSGSVTGQPVQTVGSDGRTTTGSRGTLIYQRRIVGLRQVRTPWTGSQMPLPEAGRMLEYAGTYAMRIDGTPDLPAWAFRASIRVEREQAGFVSAHIRSAVDPGNGQTQPGEQRLVTGAAALLPVAIAPSVLQQLRAGQEIDQDPVTKVRTWIEAADADTVCVSLQSPTEQSRTWFDTRTGMTVQFSRVQRQGTGSTTIQARLQR